MKRQKPGTPRIKGQLRNGFCQFPVITRKSLSRPLLESGSPVTSFLSQWRTTSVYCFLPVTCNLYTYVMSCTVRFRPSLSIRTAVPMTILNTLGTHWRGLNLKWIKNWIKKGCIGILTLPSTIAIIGRMRSWYSRSAKSSEEAYRICTSSGKP